MRIVLLSRPQQPTPAVAALNRQYYSHASGCKVGHAQQRVSSVSGASAEMCKQSSSGRAHQFTLLAGKLGGVAVFWETLP